MRTKAAVRWLGGPGYPKRSNWVQDWFPCLRREEAEWRRLPERGGPLAELVLRPGRSGGPSLGVLALSVALVPSSRRLSGSPRRSCNPDSGSRSYVPTLQGRAASSGTLATEMPVVVPHPHLESSQPTQRRCWRSQGLPSRALGARFNDSNRWMLNLLVHEFSMFFSILNEDFSYDKGNALCRNGEIFTCKAVQ